MTGGAEERVVPHGLDRFLPGLHQLTDLPELFVVEPPAGGGEHLRFFFTDVVLEEVLEDFRFRGELVGFRVGRFQRRQLDVDEMVLLGGLVEEVLAAASCRRGFERGVEDLLYDLGVGLHLALDFCDEVFPLLDGAVAGLLQLPHQTLDLRVIRLQHRDWIWHRHSSFQLRTFDNADDIQPRTIARGGTPMAVKGEERRRYGRIQLLDDHVATVDSVPVRIVEISVTGARLAHQQRFPRAATNLLRIEWHGRTIRLQCEAVRSMLVRPGEYQSGVHFVNTGDESDQALRELIGDHVTRALNEQIANARGVPPIGGYTFQVGKSDRYRKCEFVEGVWRKTETGLPAQPSNGFTISADIDPGHVQMLCQTWLACDEEGRRLTQVLAQLSIDKREGVPTRRYVP